MNATNTELALTDPKHPLHATPAPAVKEPKAKVERKAKASTNAKKVEKAPHQPSQIKSTEQNPSKSIVPPKYKTLYAAHAGTNGDNVADALKAMETVNEAGRPTIDWKTMQEIAKANDIDLSAYAHLNSGQKRMNLGNKLRGKIKAGKSVVVGKKRIAAIKAAEPVADQAKAA